MSGLTDSLFGGGAQESGGGSSIGGFGALPGDIQNQFRQFLNPTINNVLAQPDQFFRPIDLTAGELQAQQLIDPSLFGQNVETFLSPFRDIITTDINRAFEDPFSAIAQRANEAGAFGSSRQRDAQSDLERERLDAIQRAQSQQFNNAAGQLQQGIGNLLGFGGLERGLDFQQRQALPNAINFASGVFNPLLNAQQQVTRPTVTGEDSGLLQDIGTAASIASTVASFSDSRLKKNIKAIGEKIGLTLYEYEYLWSPQKYVGYMAQEVKEAYPDAVITDDSGYLAVNYGMLKDV